MAVRRPALLASLGSVLLVAVAGCSALPADLGLLGPGAESTQPVETEPGGDRFPDVLEVKLIPTGAGSYDVAVTLSSPYDTPQRYADGWRVLSRDGEVLGTHTLMHDHANEQPFTRTQRGLVIPEGIVEITVEGRDQVNGFGGLTLTVAVPRS